MKICIDPGHSGPFEPGACAGGFTEADLNLRIARFAREALELRGHVVMLTRNGAIEDNDLDWRCQMANDWGADLFISIHCNSATVVEAEGTETCYFPGSTGGLRLARCLQYSLTEALLTADRGVKEKNFAVLRETECTAVLVECGFISNPVDREMLAASQEQRRIGAAIAAGVEKYEKNLFGGVHDG